MKRQAIVIGINNYDFSPLDNAINDAQVVSESLDARGFAVNHLSDPTYQEIDDLVTQVAQNLSENDLLMFFFAGHAVEHLGYGYIFPIDIPSDSPSAVRQYAYPISKLLHATSGSRAARIFIIDACRTSFDMSSLESQILTEHIHFKKSGTEHHQDNLLLAYSTSYGMKAKDGGGANSHYSAALSSLLIRHDMTVEHMLKEIAQEVLIKSNLSQRPWFYSSLESNVSVSDLPHYSLYHSFVSPTHDSMHALCASPHDGTLLLLGNSSTIYNLNASGCARAYHLKGGTIAAAFHEGDLYLLGRDGTLHGPSTNIDLSHIEPTYICAREGYLIVLGPNTYKIFSVSDNTVTLLRSSPIKTNQFYYSAEIIDGELWVGGSYGSFEVTKLSDKKSKTKKLNLPRQEHVYSISDLNSDEVIFTCSSGKVYTIDKLTKSPMLRVSLGNTVRKPTSRRSSILDITACDDLINDFLFNPEKLPADVIETLSQHLISNDLMYSAKPGSHPLVAIGSAEGYIYIIDTRNWDCYQIVDTSGGRSTELIGMKFTHSETLACVTKDNNVMYYSPARIDFGRSLNKVDSITN
ncbi:caspase family protein [Pseudomonas sp. ESBL9]|uniref:caspase family protein n=1 Tax=Pseudomonas sp. ESBL9 TaxID=3077327 RepID=UPI002FCC2F22